MLVPEFLHEVMSIGLVDKRQNVLVFLAVLCKQFSPIAHVVQCPTVPEGGVFGGSCGLFFVSRVTEGELRLVSCQEAVVLAV